MADTQTLRKHADLVDRMSQTLGLDLEESIMRGQLQIETLGDAVLSCSGCANPGACSRWLTAQEGVANDTPDYCRNGDVFDALKSGKRI